MKKKLLALFLVLVMVMSVVPAVSAEGAFMNVQATPSVSNAAVGDTVEYTITASGKDITALEFTLIIPEGMTYVAGSAKIPAGLKDYLGWAAVDWTESSMKWTGYNDIGAVFAEGTVLMTFSCTVDTEGEHAIELFDLLPFDGDFMDVIPELTVGKVTAGTQGGEEPEPEDPTDPPMPEGAFMDVKVSASATEVNVGDTINYTIYGYGNDITALEFTLVVPEGLTYVAGSAAVPAGLKDYLAWAAVDWTESSKKWTGYNDVGAVFGKDTVLMTFSCTADVAGTYEIELFDLLPFDADFMDVIPTLAVDAVTVVIPGGECSHVYGEYTSNNDATCTADGTKSATCTLCGAVDTVADAGSAKGHTYGEYTSNNDATCTADGTKTATCSACGEKDTIADAGSAKGHDWTDADCDTAKTCKVCGATEGNALGHNYGEYVANGDATCTADGTKTATCSACGKKDTVADAGSAKGHTYGEYTSNNDATCTKDGTKTATCSACGEKDTVADAGSALGHDWTDATCTTAKTCKRCGATEGAALGHNVEYTSNNDATCTEDGTKTGTCSICGEKSTVVDEGTALGHTIKEVAATAGCETAGHTGYYACEVCDTWFEDATGSVVITDKDSVNVDALGHNDLDKDGKCDACGAEMPEEPTEKPTEKPEEPTEKPTEKPEEPTQKPTEKPEENPKTGNNGMMLYVAMMIIAACGIFCTVVLGKKKFMV